MDIRSLQLFIHLAKSLHFGKTSEAMFVSPSTLSRSIGRLEQECASQLFIRNNRSVKLTPAGHKVLLYSQSVVDNWHQLKAELDQHNQTLSGEIRVYCSVTASQSHLPTLLDGFRQLHTQVEVKLITGDHGLALERLLALESDVVIAIQTPDMPAEVAFIPLDTIVLQLIAPQHTQLSQLQQVNWTEHSVILPESGPSKRIVHHWFAEQGIRPRVYATVGGNEAIVSMVALGCGLGFVPKVVLDHSLSAQKVSRINVDNIEPYRLGLCCLKKRLNEPLIRAFVAPHQAHSGGN